MTCIAGIAEKGKVWIGGDSAGVAGWSLTVRADEKVFVNGGLVFGFTSSFRMGDILRYQLTIPSRDQDDDTRAYLVKKFIPCLRNALRENGWLTKEKEREEGGQFLVGCAGRLFEVDSDLHVGEAACGYAAVGCGHEIAKGVLFASRKLPPKERVLLALQAAEAHSAGVRRPFVVLSSNGERLVHGA